MSPLGGIALFHEQKQSNALFAAQGLASPT